MKGSIFLLLIRLASATIIFDIDDKSQVTNLEIGKNIKTSQFTLCFTLQIEEAHANIDIFEGENLGLTIKYVKKYGFFRLGKVRHIFAVPKGIFHPFAWFNFCITMNQTSYSIVVQDHHWYSFERNLDKEIPKDISIDNLSFGISPGLLISKFNIWSKAFSIYELEEATHECPGAFGSAPDIFNWDTLDLTDFGNQTAVKDIDETEICHHFVVPEVKVIPKRMQMSEAYRYCNLIGASMYFPKSLDSLKPAELETQSCSQYIWLPVKEGSKGSWVHYGNQNEVEINWEGDDPNGNELQNCAALKTTSGKAVDLLCSDPHCFACELMDLDAHFRFTGLPLDSDINLEYLLTPRLSFSGQIVFKGYENGFILYDNLTETWVVYQDERLPENLESDKIIARSLNSNPFGKNSWNLTSDIRTLKFTKCEHEEFTCGNGDCLNLDMRCDDIFDCLDLSDEDNCQTVDYDEGTYRNNDPPINRNSFTYVESHFFIHHIGELDELLMNFHVKVGLELKWKDPRLTFRNLKKYENTLSQNEIETIWIPDLTFVNTDDNIDVKSDRNLAVQILRTGGHELRGSEFLHEERTFKGVENDLNLIGNYDHFFRCRYNLVNYPFDTQRCSINVRIPDTLQKNLRLTKGTALNIGPTNLLQFEVKNVYLELKENDTEIECVIIFKRNPLYHLSTTYLPTSCILLMALITLYIDESHFEATIMVALTSMLVMYTLFQSISTDMPSTAYLKLLDYWLIFGLIMPFVIFTSEVAMELGRKNKVKHMYGKAKKGTNKIKAFVQVGLPIGCLLFVFVYSLLVANVYFSDF